MNGRTPPTPNSLAPARERHFVELQTLPGWDGAPEDVRLRRLMKAAARMYGFSWRWLPAAAADPMRGRETGGGR